MSAENAVATPRCAITTPHNHSSLDDPIICPLRGDEQPASPAPLDACLEIHREAMRQLDVIHAKYVGRLQGFLIGYALMGLIWLLAWLTW